jgi:hypothetical protein
MVPETALERKRSSGKIGRGAKAAATIGYLRFSNRRFHRSPGLSSSPKT